MTASSNTAALSAEIGTPEWIAEIITANYEVFLPTKVVPALREDILVLVQSERSSADRRIEAMREACMRVADKCAVSSRGDNDYWKGQRVACRDIEALIRSLPIPLPKRQEP